MSKQNKQSEFADCFISKQAAMQIANELQISVDGYHMHNQAVNDYCAEIGSLPEAIVRCKDCKYIEEHHYEENGEPPYIKYTCAYKAGLAKGYQVHEWDFCSRAERKEDE